MTAPSPAFSVVVPTYQRPASLARCLDALVAQTLDRARFEVIVVDDGSAEPPRGIVASVAASIDVRLIEQANAGPATARNAGAQASRGAYIVFTDDDCRPDPGWLSAIDGEAVRHPGCAIGGRIVNALDDGLYSTASQLLVEFLYEYFNVDGSEGRFFITSNLALPRESFHRIGGFDVTFPLAAAEDRDLCERWREAGLAMLYSADAIVHHAHELKLRSFCRQHFNYGRGAFHLHRARARRGEQPLRVEPPRFYLQLVGYPFSRGGGWHAVALSALMALSQGAYVSGYLSERFRSRAPSSAFARA
ncbi:MAG TPA: glycosyltransferase [Gemmatimonadaceae bacterium]|nr:glycosyltransferase [Gemmatimonadaceae bacterium]